MNRVKRVCFTDTNLEASCKIIGECLSSSEIDRLLEQCGIANITPTGTKWKRLFACFADYQNKNKESNQILRFIQKALSPELYVERKNEFEENRRRINQQLSFLGYELGENGKLRITPKASTIDDARIRAIDLKQILEERNAHPRVIKYCKAELLNNNYFHAVFEAAKGLIKLIQELSGSSFDGNNLIEYVFSDKNPVMIINSMQSQSERDEHRGFRNLLSGLCSMFRNPTAHELKYEWDINKDDALDILGTISYCYRRLDSAQKIRLA